MHIGQAGLTLLELLCSLLIVVILAMLALPNFQSLAQQYRVRGAGSVVYSHLQQARSEALKRNTDITLCFSGADTATWHYRILELSQPSRCDSPIIELIEQVNSRQFAGVMLSTAYPEPYLIVKPRRNSWLSGSVILSQGSQQIKVITWNNGIIRTCSDSQLPGVPPC